MLIGLEANTNTKYLPAPFHELQYFEGLLLKLMCGNESELNQAWVGYSSDATDTSKQFASQIQTLSWFRIQS